MFSRPTADSIASEIAVGITSHNIDTPLIKEVLDYERQATSPATALATLSQSLHAHGLPKDFQIVGVDEKSGGLETRLGDGNNYLLNNRGTLVNEQTGKELELGSVVSANAAGDSARHLLSKINKVTPPDSAEHLLGKGFEIIDPDDSSTLAKSFSRDYIADTVSASVGNNVQGSLNSDGSFSVGYTTGKFTLDASNAFGAPTAAPTIELMEQVNNHMSVGVIADTGSSPSIKIGAAIYGF